MRLCFASDLHGLEAHYRQLYDLVRREHPQALLLGGDQCPLTFGATNESQQRHWLATCFRDFLAAVSPICPVYWTSGNHDLAATLDELERLAQEFRLYLCDGRCLALGDGLSLAGLCYGPISGWPFIDWEAPDEGQSPSSHATQAFATIDGRLTPVQSTAYFAGRPTLAQRWEVLAVADPSTTLLVSHYPPFGTGLDWTASERFVGSHALMTHLAGHAYPLALHGHIHEAPFLSGYWARQLGPTVAVNPGQWIDGLHAILFEWPNVVATLTHTVFGRVWSVAETQTPTAMRQQLDAFLRRHG